MFDRFFNSSNPYWIAMGKVFDVFVLNCLLLVCCIPVITIGPALTAFYYAMISLVRDEEVSVSREFLHSFRMNLKQGMLLGIGLTALNAFLMFDVYICRHSGTGIYTFFMVFFAVIFLFVLPTSLYCFALLSRFEKTSRELLPLAFTMAVSHPLSSLLILLSIAFAYWIMRIIPGLLFLLLGLVGMFHAAQFNRILNPYLPDKNKCEDLPLRDPEDMNDIVDDTKGNI